MKAIRYQSAGDSSLNRFIEVADPQRRDPQQILIDVKAFALNRADILQRQGLYPPPPGESDIPGLEAAGIVAEAAPGSPFKPGDRVMALLGSGGYAQKVVAHSGLTMNMPSHFSFAEGAAIAEAFLTAHHNLFTIGLLPRDSSLLVHAGASGVGTAAIQLAKARGVRVLVTVGSVAKAAFCESLGAEPILYKEVDFAKAVSSLTAGEGVRVVLDCVGASYLRRNLLSLATGGTLVSIGMIGGGSGMVGNPEAELSFSVLLGKRLQIKGSTLRSLSTVEKTAIVRRFSEDFTGELHGGAIRPIIHRTYPSDGVAEAQDEMERDANIGKIVVCW